MKVLRVIGGLEPRMGGPSESAVNSAVAAHLAGISTLVVFPGDGVHSRAGTARFVRAEVPYREFRHVSAGRARARKWGMSYDLFRALRGLARDSDVVHAHGAWTASAIAALVAAKLARTPFVLTPHEALTEVDVTKSQVLVASVKRLLRRFYFLLADAIVVSSELESRSSSVGRHAGRKLIVVPHAVAEGGPAPPGSPRDRCGPLVVGFLGRYDPKKNLPLLLDALAASPHAVLTVAGSGDASVRTAVVERVQELDLGDRVQLLGWLDADARVAFFRAIDVLALPSEYECFGMAAAEAIVAGIPVVVGTETGIAEIVRRHGCGVVTQPDPQRLAETISSLSQGGQLAELAAHTASARVELSYDAHAAALDAVYRRVMHVDARDPASATVAAS